MKPVLTLLVAVFMTLAWTACGVKPIPPTSSPLPETKPLNGLMEEWHSLAKEETTQINFSRAMEIANKMAEQGPAGLEPFFVIVEDPDATPAAKMLATVSLISHINNNHIPRLVTIIESEYDSATRGCAVHLLSRAPSTEAFFLVHDLMDDDDSHVSKLAVMAMLRHGDAEALERALALWDASETLARDRSEIILAMPDIAAWNHLHIFQGAFCQMDIDVTARERAIQLLENYGTMNMISDLDACLKIESNPSMRDRIQSAIDAIRKRDEEGIVEVPMQSPPGMNVVLDPHASDATAEPVTPEISPEPINEEIPATGQ